MKRLLKGLMWVSAAALFAVGCSTAQPIGVAGDQRSSFVGPAGAEGPAGPAGMQGPVGRTGAAGAVVVGRAGVTGPAGPAGAQGPSGQTGAQGYSLVGRAGPIGPTGPARRSGPAGAQGIAGDTGAQGYLMAGDTGLSGRSGVAGSQGPIGATGAQGPVGMVNSWTSFRDFWFDFNRADIQPSDTSKASEIADYMNQNPSLRVGIDGSMDPRGTDPRNQGLSDRRVDAVRDALIQAGVPASKIRTGAFGDARLTRDRRVEVLISTAN